ncbi:MAG: phosphocarrier protein HPr [Thermodesulfobacteriota bacterium]|nr:MAG: phosphocarrier protein HPr [Thermodesulfobacteriota bacterium]
MTDKEHSKVLKVKNKLGLHARAAAVFVRTSSKFTSEVKLIKDGYEVNGKSILGVLSLAAIKGSELQVVTSGSDAETALKGIQELVESGFGEGIEE